jgi:small subunit ribosomal protein S2
VIPGNDDAIRAIKLFVESAADAVDTGKLSVAHAVADSTDEFVELDEGDAVKQVKKKARAATKKTADKVTVKKTAAPKKPAAEPEAAATPQEGEADKAEAGKE